MRRATLACGLGVTLATTGCLGGGGSSGDAKPRKSALSQNRAPVISGHSPAEAPADEYFDFRPRANDPDGDLLVFSISNKPVWARFNPETGRLHGTPGAADVGVYTGITIVVSDGQSSTMLPAFDLTVAQASSGVVTLSWKPPTQNEDGSALRDLAGYRIYLGRNPDSLSRVIVLNNPGLTRYVVENLSPATWHFAMTSFSRGGSESRRSATVSKRVG
ncbi:MAG: hypothetical protein FJ171_00870 [Gammaproteobacteria bacterium]|nr:hypothetical protein [Gammaproteobacteria bacterium]